MSPTTAALVVLTAVTVVLALAMVGLRQQIRALQVTASGSRRVGHADRRSVRQFLDHDGPRVVLLVSPGCRVCTTVTPMFAGYAGTVPDKLMTLSRSRVASVVGLESRVDPAFFNAVDPGWTPAAVFVNETNEITAIEPVGSPAALRAAMTKHRDPTTDPSTVYLEEESTA